MSSCPECGTKVLRESGCMHCPSCGWAACGHSKKILKFENLKRVKVK